MDGQSMNDELLSQQSGRSIQEGRKLYSSLQSGRSIQEGRKLYQSPQSGWSIQ